MAHYNALVNNDEPSMMEVVTAMIVPSMWNSHQKRGNWALLTCHNCLPCSGAACLWFRNRICTRARDTSMPVGPALHL